jgi:hypothetical protein
VSSTVSRPAAPRERERAMGGDHKEGNPACSADVPLNRERRHLAVADRHAVPSASHLPMSVVATCAATGVLIVTAAYTAGWFGRASLPGRTAPTGSVRPASWCQPHSV